MSITKDMRFDKLVRDKIPDIIRSKGEVPVVHTANDEEYWKKLKEKLNEEVAEFIDAENQEEIADILEVLMAISNVKRFAWDGIEDLRRKKVAERGGFEAKIILEET
jgi:predicted house-cleaning noncanonical NTP pyrophosphatase (MazG superfamily)